MANSSTTAQECDATGMPYALQPGTKKYTNEKDFNNCFMYAVSAGFIFSGKSIYSEILY